MPPVAHDIKVISVGMFKPRATARRVARADAAPGPAAVPRRRLLGRPRRPADGPAARHRRHRDLRGPAACRRPSCSSSPPRSRPPPRWPSAPGSIAAQTHQQIAGVIENMSWLPCPHCDERIEVFGEGGGQTVADALTRALGARVPLLGQVPIDMRLREGGDEGKPLVLTDPDAPAALELDLSPPVSARSRAASRASSSASPPPGVAAGRLRHDRQRGAPFSEGGARVVSSYRGRTGRAGHAQSADRAHKGQKVRMGAREPVRARTGLGVRSHLSGRDFGRASLPTYVASESYGGICP